MSLTEHQELDLIHFATGVGSFMERRRGGQLVRESADAARFAAQIRGLAAALTTPRVDDIPPMPLTEAADLAATIRARAASRRIRSRYFSRRLLIGSSAAAACLALGFLGWLVSIPRDFGTVAFVPSGGQLSSSGRHLATRQPIKPGQTFNYVHGSLALEFRNGTRAVLKPQLGVTIKDAQGNISITDGGLFLQARSAVEVEFPGGVVHIPRSADVVIAAPNMIDTYAGSAELRREGKAYPLRPGERVCWPEDGGDVIVTPVELDRVPSWAGAVLDIIAPN